MYKKLKEISQKPALFSEYTADHLWTDEYRAQQMLSYHLNSDIDAASRNKNFIDRSVSWIKAYFGLTAASKVVDFGCGPGLYTSRLTKQGIQVTGIDFSGNSIRYAKEYAARNDLDIKYIQQNYLDFKPEDQFDLAMMIMCDFGVLSPEQRAKMLNVIYTSLQSGGKLLLDVLSLQSYEEKSESAIYEYNQLHQFWSEQNYFGFVNTFKYEEAKVTLDKYTIVQEDGTTFSVYNWFQHFSPSQLKKELEAAGFVVKKYLKNVAGDTYSEQEQEFAVIAVKP